MLNQPHFEAERGGADPWARAREGRSTALLGSDPSMPPNDLAVVAVDCGHARDSLSLARAVLTDLADLFGEPPAAWLPGEPQGTPSVYQRMLGLAPERGWGQALVQGLSELARRSGGRAAVLLTDLDAATADGARLAGELLARAPRLGVPMVIHTASADGGPEYVQRVVERLRQAEGDAGVIRARRRSRAPVEVEVEPAEPAGVAGRTWTTELPDEALWVLRAGAVAGPQFRVEDVALLLGLEPGAVLIGLQRAHDAGVPLRDHGGGVFTLDEGLSGALSEGLLPSVQETWTRALAEWHEAPSEQKPPPERAARHAEAVGDVEGAVRHSLDACRQALALGMHDEAQEQGQRAVATLDGAPRSDARRRLQIEALCLLAEVQWRAAGTGLQFSLDAALEYLKTAEGLLQDDDPPALSAQLHTLLAHVLYDQGTPEALEDALEIVTETSRRLMDAGEPLLAARLLNDEAAIWVRLGDPVRAKHLLDRAHEVFSGLAASSEEARVEAAHTEHMLARLVLHVAPKPGKEQEAPRIGIEHARVAEDVFTELGMEREAAFVHETIGRLERMAGREEAAEAYLRRAHQSHEERADALGLARSTAGLAELYAARGETRRALQLLGQSVNLNAERGSSVGLAYNRRTLEAIGRDLQGDAAKLAASVTRKLEDAEAMVGKVDLPPEPEPPKRDEGDDASQDAPE